MKKIFILLFALSSALVSNAQQPHICGADHMHHHLRNTDPEFEQRAADYNRQIREFIAANRENRNGEDVLIIPVVFHIIHNWGPENISDEQIFDQMRILNEDYRLLNEDTINVINYFRQFMGDTRVEFRLAQKDFEGNCTNGIDRIASTETFSANDGSKLNPWPRDRYLNIWVVNTLAGDPGLAGYSYYPSAVSGGIAALRDGVIMEHNYVGSIGTSSPGGDNVLTHEIGHWLNLAHTWGDTNDPGIGCGDDNVEDTPVTAGRFGCPDDPFSCNSNILNADFIYNFNDVTLTSGTIDPTPRPATVENRLTLAPAKAIGLSPNSASPGRFAFSGWSQSATIDLQKYYEFQISTDMATGMTLTELRFNIRRNGSGPQKVSVRGSHNNFASNLGASVSSNPFVTVSSNTFNIVDEVLANDVVGLRINLDIPNYANVREGTITLRIYGWDAQNETGTLEIDNVVISGTYGQVENINNFMDYSSCTFMFTQGQVDRMRAALALPLAGRSTLYTQQNLEFTGVINNSVLGCAPVTDFYPERVLTCVGTPVRFYDYTQFSTPTSHFWDFGEAGTSTLANPLVTFNTPGWKTVTYTSSNQFGSMTVTKTLLYVSGTPNYQSGLVQESFSNEQIFNDNYIVRNLDNNSSFFQWTDVTGFNDLGCAYLNAFDMDPSLIDNGDLDVDQLYFPPFDFSSINGQAQNVQETITFKYSYATAAAAIVNITDYFVLESSDDCGLSWSQRTPIGVVGNNPRVTGTALVSGGSYTTSYTPTGQADWKTISYVIPNNLFNENAMFRITFVTGSYPNNFYIDDIQVNAVLSVDDINADQQSFMLYPNPTANSTQVEFSLIESQDVTISVSDLSGRIVFNELFPARNTGLNNITLPIDNLSDGMYMVTVRTNKTAVSQRLVVRN